MEWYKFNINDMTDAEYKTFFELMSEEKKTRVSRFKNIDDKKRSVCAEMLAKKVISGKFSVSPLDIKIGAKDSGQPFCENFNIHLSLSHSGDYAACAVSDAPVGIDIQKIVPYNRKTAEKVCSAPELSAIENSGDTAAEFIKLWTKKEAVLKKSGTGVICSMKDCLDGQAVKTFRVSDYFVSICDSPL